MSNKDNETDLQTNTTFFKFGLIAWFPLLLCGYLIAYLNTKNIKLLPDCYLYQLTGLICPGCGCTRATFALLRGNIRSSFCYNPSVIFALLEYLYFMLSYLFHTWVDKKKRQKAVEIYIYVFLAVVFAQWLIKLVFHLY